MSQINQMSKKAYDLAKNLFISTGDCKHLKLFQYDVRPYKCNVTLTCCGICNKNLEKVYDSE